MLRWVVRIAAGVLAALVLLAVGGAAMAVSRLPGLQPWHQLVSSLEPRAAEITPAFTLDDYLEREKAVFDEARMQVDDVVSRGADPSVPNRYVASSISHPSRYDTDWNRTRLEPAANAIGGALLVHGLTDSPYSMRTLAAHLRSRGFTTLNLRMQGHGTVPGGLVDVEWEDWMAAVRMGARALGERLGPDRPLVLVGYSNGGALVTKYALDALADPSLPAPSRLVLVSPMIGVSPLAGLARAISRLGPVIEKARWLDVVPEYNPFKYNSFPANAAEQTARLTRALDEAVTRAVRDGSIARLPPVLAFQSVVDATVSAPAVVTGLFDRLPAGGHELVLFDINRQTGIDAFTTPGAVLPRLTGGGPRRYAATIISNTSPDTFDVSAYTVPAGSTAVEATPLGLSWPREMFSLAHVALPFDVTDPLYGADGDGGGHGGVALGRLVPRGEKGVLVVPLDALMRTSWNPFFRCLLERLDLAVNPG